MKKVVLLCFTVISLITTVFLCLIIGEHFFFNELLYQRSPWHGYANDISAVGIYSQDSFIAKQVLSYRVESISKMIKSEREEKSYFEKKDPTTQRIVIIGDSMTYGQGIRLEQTYPKILEKLLNQTSSHTIEVYVLALPGDDIVDHYIKFQLAQKYLQPDLTLIALYENDLIEVFGAKYPTHERTYQKLQAQCQATEFVKQVSPDQTPENIWLENILPSYSDQYANRCYFERIVHWMANRNTRVLFFSMAPFKQEEKSCSVKAGGSQEISNYIGTFFQETVRQQTMTELLYFDEYQKYYDRVSTLEGHASSETHKYLASQLYAIVCATYLC